MDKYWTGSIIFYATLVKEIFVSYTIDGNQLSETNNNLMSTANKMTLEAIPVSPYMDKTSGKIQIF